MKKFMVLFILVFFFVPLVGMNNDGESTQEQRLNAWYDNEWVPWQKKEETRALLEAVNNDSPQQVSEVLFGKSLFNRTEEKTKRIQKTGSELANAIATNDGRPMLSYAINYNGNPNVIDLLLKAGARANAVYNQKVLREGSAALFPADAAHQALTPLHAAVAEYRCWYRAKNEEKKVSISEEIINLLLKYGADPNALNGAGNSPYVLAQGTPLQARFDNFLEQKRNKERVLAFAGALHTRCGANSPARNLPTWLLKDIARFVALPVPTGQAEVNNNTLVPVQTASWLQRITTLDRWWARLGLVALGGLGAYHALRALQVPRAGKLSLCLSTGICLAKPMAHGITWVIDHLRSKKR